MYMCVGMCLGRWMCMCVYVNLKSSCRRAHVRYITQQWERFNEIFDQQATQPKAKSRAVRKSIQNSAIYILVVMKP